VPSVTSDELAKHRAIIVDCNLLVAWSSEKTSAADRDRLDFFLETASKHKQKIIIPMPVLAEFLVRTDAATAEWLAVLERKSAVEIAPFDRIAAVDCALLDRAAIGSGDKKDGLDQPWQKIKIDRQIVAIGKSRSATLVVSDDKGIRNNALRCGMLALTIAELPQSPESAQSVIPGLSKSAPKSKK
jgi:predicted nucleic acid-binding protein